MNTPLKTICLLCVGTALSALAVQAQEPVSIESSLTEMVNRDSVARTV
ncbi:hypothetical protein ACFL6U_08350 [Planctomycetota bacterium]